MHVITNCIRTSRAQFWSMNIHHHRSRGWLGIHRHRSRDRIEYIIYGHVTDWYFSASALYTLVLACVSIYTVLSHCRFIHRSLDSRSFSEIITDKEVTIVGWPSMKGKDEQKLETLIPRIEINWWPMTGQSGGHAEDVRLDSGQRSSDNCIPREDQTTMYWSKLLHSPRT